MNFSDRLKHSWDAFFNNRDPSYDYKDYGYSSSTRPDRTRLTPGNERSIINAIYNRMALDVASINMEHVRLDENEEFIEELSSGLGYCLKVEANIDQTGRAFKQDVVMSMMDEGVVAIVPTKTNINPMNTGSYEIEELRTGKIIQWYPKHVKVRVYNGEKGIKEDLIYPKKIVGIIENPFYSIMNEPNSTYKRLVHKLNIMDNIDEEAGANKLDLIIQLPYVIKSEARKDQAERRRKEIEMQLSKSKYGIAYTDGTEHITQLGHSIENNLQPQVEQLTKLLMSQLGITEEILNGTANEETMLNYYNRTIEPFLTAIADELKRKFLTKTARSQGQSIIFFRDPFKLVPLNQLADIVDKFSRNEVMSPNEFRGKLGLKPSAQEGANDLRNRNMPVQDQPQENQNGSESDEIDEESYNRMNSQLDDLDAQLDEAERSLG